MITSMITCTTYKNVREDVTIQRCQLSYQKKQYFYSILAKTARILATNKT